jgi:hypothetical protein
VADIKLNLGSTFIFNIIMSMLSRKGQTFHYSDSERLSFSLMSQSSSLASVVGSHPDDLAKWTLRLISGRDALSQLHKKCWGKSMADEERDWHVANDSTPDSRDRSKDDVQSCVGQDEGMDDGSMSEDKSMDNAGNMDGASDIVSGCYVLELRITEILRRPIWIRV